MVLFFHRPGEVQIFGGALEILAPERNFNKSFLSWEKFVEEYLAEGFTFKPDKSTVYCYLQATLDEQFKYKKRL